MFYFFYFKVENPCGFLLLLTEAKSASGEGKQSRLSGGPQLPGFLRLTQPPTAHRVDVEQILNKTKINR